MSDFSGLKNTGLLTVGQSPKTWEKKRRTIIVLGIARSGTSLVSGALHHLGVFMGDRSLDPVFEDLRLSEAIESGLWADVDKILEEYTSKYFVWGYKRPRLIQDENNSYGKFREKILGASDDEKPFSSTNMMRLHHKLINPLYIIIFKDIFSIAYRTNISSNTDIFHSMKNSLAGYEKIVDFISHFSPNALLVSYEKALSNKGLFIETLIDFCRIKPERSQIDMALSFIAPDPKKYLDVSRNNKAIGYLDKVSLEKILGWARYANDERIAEVVLIVDGKEVKKVRADLFRQDLLDHKVHSKGTCAFEFKGFDTTLFKDGSMVRVKVVDEINDLENSPFLFKHD